MTLNVRLESPTYEEEDVGLESLTYEDVGLESLTYGIWSNRLVRDLISDLARSARGRTDR